MNKFRLTLDTFDRNYRHSHWPKEAVFEAFQEPLNILDSFFKLNAAIDADRHLTAEGKAAARLKAGRATTEGIAKWHTPRLAGLDAALGLHRASLAPPATEKPDSRKLDLIAARMQTFSEQETAVLYNSAPDEQRQLMEIVSVSIGPVPMKTGNGLEWKTLLDPALVHESVIARASATNPDAVQKFQELADIRAMHVSVAGIALAEVRDALAAHNLDA